MYYDFKLCTIFHTGKIVPGNVTGELDVANIKYLSYLLVRSLDLYDALYGM